MTLCEQGRRRESEAVVKPSSNVAAAVVKPVETDDGREWSKLMKPVERVDTAARISLPRFFFKRSIFCLAGFEQIKMVNDRLANGRFGGT